LLRGDGHQVEIHADHFPDVEESDSAWLTEVGRRRWVVLSKNPRIRKVPAERHALMAAGVRAFFLRRGHRTGVEMYEIFKAAMPRILNIVAKHPGPFIALISKNGEIEIL